MAVSKNIIIPLRAIPDYDKDKKTGSFISLNSIRCKHCGDTLVSSTVHDFKMCKCGKVGIDGGLEYLKRVGELEDIVDLSKVIKIGEKEYLDWKRRREDYFNSEEYKQAKMKLDFQIIKALSSIRTDWKRTVSS